MSNMNNTGANVTNATLGPYVSPSTAQQLEENIPVDIKIGMTTAYAMIFFIALFGNSVGLFIVLKKASTNVTNLFMANMAVADLLLTFTVMPYQVAQLYRGSLWFGGILGNITCKLLLYAIPVSIAASVLTMMIISIDRFYAIFYPLREKIFQRPKILSAIIWILSFVLMLPNVFLSQAQFDPAANEYVCIYVWPWEDPDDHTHQETYRVMKIFHIFLFIIMYALPLFITITIYALICRKLLLREIPGNITDSNRNMVEKSRRKVVRLLVVICVVFALCWFPSYVNHFFWYVRPEQSHELSLEVTLVFLWIAHANSAINPCLYILLNRTFRRELFANFRELCARETVITVAATPARLNASRGSRGWMEGQRMRSPEAPERTRVSIPT